MSFFSRITSGFARRSISLSTRRFTTTERTVQLTDDSLVLPYISETPLPFLWLRDSSPECKHPATTQKLHSSTDIDVDIRPKQVNIVKDGDIQIDWSDGHVSVFPKSFLERHATRENLSKFRQDVDVRTWNRKDLERSSDLFVKYEEVKTPTGLLKAIDQLCRYGLVFVRNVPSEPEVSVNELAHQFANEIRETFYGRIFHVKNTGSENIAYTNLKLGLHMDLLYFENPPRYQALHCLRNSVQGGTSVFSDTFDAAKSLKSQYPEDYAVLAKTPVPYEYLYGDHHLHCSHPVIEEDHYNPALEDLPIKCINYAPPFQAPLLLSTPSALRQFYLALGRFDSMLNSPEQTYSYTLQEGDAMIFDNRRVLHARTAFKDSEGSQKGPDVNRWLQGCYFEGDTMKDRGRVLRAKQRTGSL